MCQCLFGSLLCDNLWQQPVHTAVLCNQNHCKFCMIKSDISCFLGLVTRRDSVFSTLNWVGCIQIMIFFSERQQWLSFFYKLLCRCEYLFCVLLCAKGLSFAIGHLPIYHCTFYMSIPWIFFGQTTNTIWLARKSKYRWSIDGKIWLYSFAAQYYPADSISLASALATCRSKAPHAWYSTLLLYQHIADDDWSCSITTPRKWNFW